jgi:hypothetical protein
MEVARKYLSLNLQFLAHVHLSSKSIIFPPTQQSRNGGGPTKKKSKKGLPRTGSF